MGRGQAGTGPLWEPLERTLGGKEPSFLIHSRPPEPTGQRHSDQPVPTSHFTSHFTCPDSCAPKTKNQTKPTSFSESERSKLCRVDRGGFKKWASPPVLTIQQTHSPKLGK